MEDYDHQFDTDLLRMAQKHLRTEISGVTDLCVVDISGMSNKTFIVGLRPEKHSRDKVVIRFFKNKVSDFHIESQVFKKMGERKKGPREIEANPVFRVEEYIDGRPLTFLELRNPFVAERIMQMICEANYDKELRAIVSKDKQPGCNFSMDFIYDTKKGWFNTYFEKVRPVLQTTDLEKYPRA